MVRVKNRYIAFQILYPPTGPISETPFLEICRSTPAEVSSRHVMDAIKDQVQLHFGDHGVGVVSSNFQLKYFSNKTSTGILKVGRGQPCDMVLWSMIFVDTLGPHKVCLQVKRVSGTIRKAEDFLIVSDKQDIERAKRERDSLTSSLPL